MGLLLALLLGLAAIAATPEVEAPQFILDTVATCVPHFDADFAGCAVPVAAYAPDETGYAGWSKGSPVTGP